MKTTIELSDAVLIEARALAQREGTTLRALVESGLRQVMAQKRRARQPFRLRMASVKGRGLQPPLRSDDWDRWRELAYEGRGG